MYTQCRICHLFKLVNLERTYHFGSLQLQGEDPVALGVVGISQKYASKDLCFDFYRLDITYMHINADPSTRR
ncbi:hypothetical protein Plhal304r1_c014g0051411 [Plasmopara halstedii]